MLSFLSRPVEEGPCTVYGPAGRSMEDRIAQACEDLRVPQWVKPILKVAAKMKNDKLRRKKAYRMLRTQLWYAGIGLECAPLPTYVYPVQLKTLIRSLFPEDICNYPDPDHGKLLCRHLCLHGYKREVNPVSSAPAVISSVPFLILYMHLVVKVTLEDLFLVKTEKSSKPTVKCMKVDPELHP